MIGLINIGNIGLLLTIVGSLITASATGKPVGGDMGWSISSANGKTRRSSVVALNHPYRYKVGLYLIAIGTLFQIKAN